MDLKYKFVDSGKSITVNAGKKDGEFFVDRMDHSSITKKVVSDVYFNRGIRRGDTMLISGDKPRIAIMKTYHEPTYAPDLIKLGDARIFIKCGDFEEWLENADSIKTQFNPGNTRYDITFDKIENIAFRLDAYQAEGWGMILRLTSVNKSTKDTVITAEMTYGGLTHCARTFTASYFGKDLDDVKANNIEIIDDLSILTSENIADFVAVGSLPRIKPEKTGLKTKFIFDLAIPAGEIRHVDLIVSHSEIKAESIDYVLKADPDKLFIENDMYYEKILSSFTIDTPDEIIDAGLKIAVLNMDYDYDEPAWLEGVHFWNAYLNDNYQISAAITLGQMDRVMKSIEFFGSFEEGFDPVFASHTTIGHKSNKGFDGLPYYLHQLFQYYDHTGDLEMMKKLWLNITETMDNLLAKRDLNKNHLIDWKYGSNSFLYQADHLGQSGDAAGPSLIIAGLLEKLSQMAEILGKHDESIKWKTISDSMYEKLPEYLWSRKNGYFYSQIDYDGLKHKAHYYTDLVFPSLYTRLPDEYCWQSMDHLTESLVFDSSESGLKLMRIGDYKPSLFGNDNVMPVQMSEAARAYFMQGDIETGYNLLHAVAMGGTLFTEAPGNYPERMSDDGKGEANYIFGNPIGAYIYSIIGGLFGLSVIDAGKTIKWEPSFPDSWDHASIGLNYVKSGFECHKDADFVKKIFRLESNDYKNLSFSIFLEPFKNCSVEINGKKAGYEYIPALDKTKIFFTAEIDTKVEIVIEYTLMPAETFNAHQSFGTGSTASWEFSQDIEFVSDPREALYGIRITNNRIDSFVSDNIGKHTIYVQLKNIPVVYQVKFEIKPKFNISCKNAIYDASQKTITLDVGFENNSSFEDKIKIYAEINNHHSEFDILDKNHKTASIKLDFPNSDMIPYGTYTVKYFIKNEKELVFKSAEDIIIKGVDSETNTLMVDLKERMTSHLDISKLYTSKSIFASSLWRKDPDYIVDISKLLVDKHIQTPDGSFYIADENRYIANVEKGWSDMFTRLPNPSKYSDHLFIEVNQKVRMISFLYANEMEIRHTYERVGSIKFIYDDMTEDETPLIVGENFDSLYMHFAKIPTPVNTVNNEFIKVLSLPCNPGKTLMNIKISIDVYDAAFGLIGVNLIKAVF
ncbi:MAG: hypothetical protein ACYCYI_14855 [Saccharofermentanales bacterium]